MTEETTTPSRGITRRHALTGAAVVGVAVPTLAACGSSGSSTSSPSGAGSTSGSTSGSAGAASSGSSGAAASGFAKTSDIPEGGGAIFADQGVVVTQPTAGTYQGFTNICTHQGCPLASVSTTINCDCHGSKFSIKDGSNVAGPNGSPAGSTAALAAVAIKVTGTEIAKS